MRNNNPLTADVIIATLNRSSLKTVLIEGKDDLQIYRNIESELDIFDLDILPCGGRKTLLKVYRRKNELKSNPLFICDSDLWIFINKPSDLNSDLIATVGYSIENELYQDGKRYIDPLLTIDERTNFNTLLHNVCEWFAYEVEKFMNNNAYDCEFSEVSLLNEEVISKGQFTFLRDFLDKRNFISPDDKIKNDIISNFSLKLRGKFIFQIYEKIFKERKKGSVKYNRDTLFDLMYRYITEENNENSIIVKRKN